MSLSYGAVSIFYYAPADSCPLRTVDPGVPFLPVAISIDTGFRLHVHGGKYRGQERAI